MGQHLVVDTKAKKRNCQIVLVRLRAWSYDQAVRRVWILILWPIAANLRESSLQIFEANSAAISDETGTKGEIWLFQSSLFFRDCDVYWLNQTWSEGDYIAKTKMKFSGDQ